ncbi:MAG: hypothetical protein PPFGHCPK_00915 [Spiroplasma endosymbiont of Drosophila atripex]|nr:MAG: hypothetical protein PPFGHCPK_00201 [Spiroplasma endosymbiont of Drosophila atripex]WDA54014.1 MAG: hypothetical protein PPFGHCPK_00430 [Spiroplasma endosymbiont of Drosophila atripex]WDA54468.1 MAG: hypothetical protein PPFGHCPK_00915 [Spiroplasma endosymbiont of Drosophila atripex]
MTNYLLSIDPSIKNTGFTLWEKEYKYDKNLNYWPTREYVYCEIHNDNNVSLKIIKECKNCYENEIIWKPILISSYSFKQYGVLNFESEIFFNNMKDTNIDLIIERGIFNPKMGRGKETLDHLRDFIAGQFNKLLTKDMLISPKEWQNWYLKKYFNKLENKKIWNDKEISFSFTLRLIVENNWNITISNHDEADSLLIGWYYLNKEVK